MTTGAESLLTLPERVLSLFLLLVVASVAVRTLYRRYSLIRSGRPVPPGDQSAEGALARFLVYVPGQWSNIRSISGKDLAGIQHLMLFWGAIFFALYYLLFFIIGEGFGFAAQIRENLPARIFLSVTEILGLLLVVALVWGVIRRSLLKPGRLGPDFEETLFLLITVSATFLLAGFFSLEAFRVSLQQTSYAGPLSGLLVGLFAGHSGDFVTIYHVSWWLQLVVMACFIVYVPYSSHQHAIFAPFNILASNPQPKGRLSTPQLSEKYRGLHAPEDFTWKQLLEVYGCTQCGRCQDACPAATAGKPLSPKKIIQHIRASVDETGNLRPFWKSSADDGQGSGQLDHAVSDGEVWSCTTCMACAEVCPAFVSSLDKIVDLRRDRVMAHSRFFPEVTTLFRDLENYGDVFGKGRARREDWALGKNIKVLTADNEADALFWVGCQASFQDRSTKSAASLAEVLCQGGIDLAIMGKEEFCCGDPLRRLGNEYQYQNFVRRNIAALKKLRFKRIVTYCPHCYNTLKNEYPQLGGEFEVLHYTEILGDMLRSKNLETKKAEPTKVVYHDPCYLARGNGIAKGNEILALLPGTTALEVERSGAKTFCCGGGGGTMWMRETGGEKINTLRVKELVKDVPEVIASSCPYCVVMLEEGVRSLGLENVQCKDLIEVVRESL